MLPENLGVVVDPDVAKADAQFQAVADGSGAVVVAGMTHVYTLGTALTLFSARGNSTQPAWGVAICQDFDFTTPARAMAGRAWA